MLTIASRCRVWGEHRDTSWPGLLDFWGLPNLQVINRDVHAAKCASEARDRRISRGSSSKATVTSRTIAKRADTVPFRCSAAWNVQQR